MGPKIREDLPRKSRRNVFVSFEQRFQFARKQREPPDAGNNLRKSHFIMYHVTKYSTILGVFQQPWPGVSPIPQFERGEGPGDEVALTGYHKSR